jgi:REP element-mobilizing transposase RayT
MVQDHVHMLIRIPPKYAVSTVGFEEVQIRAYIKQQEQLDAQGSDESGEF